MARHDLRNTNRNASIFGPQGPPDAVWSRSVGAVDPSGPLSGFATGPIGDGRGRVYAGGESLRAFDSQSGDPVWTVSDPAARFTTPALADGDLLAVGYDPDSPEARTVTLFVVDPTTGAVGRRVPVADVPPRTRVRVSAPKAAGGRAFFFVASQSDDGSSTGRIYAVSPGRGAVCWCRSAAVAGATVAVDRRRGLLIAAGDPPAAYALADGSEAWSGPEGLPAPETEPLVGDDSVFFAGRERVYALSIRDGSVEWNARMPDVGESAYRSAWTPLAVRTDASTLYLGSRVDDVTVYEDPDRIPPVERASLYALDTGTGGIVSAKPLPVGLRASVPAIRAAPGLPAFVGHESGLSAPVLSNESLYVKTTEVSDATGAYDDGTNVVDGIARYDVREGGGLSDPVWSARIESGRGDLAANLALAEGTLYLHAEDGSESRVVAYQDLE